VLEVGTLAAFGLFLVRTSAFVLATPFFGAQSVFGGVKVGLIASLALILFSVHGAPLPEASSPAVFAVLAVRELLIGVSLAFVLQTVVLAVRVAGEMIGNEMAFNMASVVDPGTGANTPMITQLYEALFLLGLLAVDGHHLLLRALASSFERAPVGSATLGSGLAESAITLLSDLFTAGLTFAAPVLVLLVLSSILVGLVARTMPYVNVMEVGFSLRIIAGLFAMTLFAPLVAPALGRLYGMLGTGLDQALAALES
jgi:flagellar biosynthesis protein FliR